MSSDSEPDAAPTEIPSVKANFLKNPKKNLLEKYEEHKGKTLYIRFPKKLPEDQNELLRNVKDLSERVISVRRPRQKSVRFCLVDFDSKTDRDKALKELKTKEIDGKPLLVALPNFENEKYLEKLKEKQKQKQLEKRAKQKLKKQARKEGKIGRDVKKSLTATLIIRNIPRSANAAAVKRLFPTALECNVVFPKNLEETAFATVTFPTPQDATKVKRENLTLGGNALKSMFATPGYDKKKAKTTPGKDNKQQGLKRKAEPNEVIGNKNGKQKKKPLLKVEPKESDDTDDETEKIKISPKQKKKILPKELPKAENDSVSEDEDNVDDALKALDSFENDSEDDEVAADEEDDTSDDEDANQSAEAEDENEEEPDDSDDESEENESDDEAEESSAPPAKKPALGKKLPAPGKQKVPIQNVGKNKKFTNNDKSQANNNNKQFANKGKQFTSKGKQFTNKGKQFPNKGKQLTNGKQQNQNPKSFNKNQKKQNYKNNGNEFKGKFNQEKRNFNTNNKKNKKFKAKA